MHLIIPYAASHGFFGQEALTGLQLPNLQALLALLQRQQVMQDTDTTPLYMPHERLHASALGWNTADTHASLPWAAWHNACNNPRQVTTNALHQAWMTPCHWQVGMDQVVMADPAHLQLSDEESQQLLEAMQPFLLEDGLQVTWHSALLWHASGDMLAELATASLDRVIGQNVKDWMPAGTAARPLQRLQSEMQMLLYNHPVNNARDARRQIAVNSFWPHGAGTLPVDAAISTPHLKIPDALRHSALRGDVQAWRQAWQQLDATAMADLLAHFKATGQATLSLCSEHAAHTYTAAPAGWHQRTTRAFQRLFNKATPAAALQALITP
ncbi:hypothetical protein B9Z47_10245 [Limnohabitans sp. 2KL-1]|uniref:hypothetical protein n=1 Tax=Limnohabitans sp. 2KL-1 TaxID=1100699 RepID=UPI000D3B2A4A|nr:hypothetical protein [Limnohabitans sp. 2KL-1]PUE48185.1 hypothetical protein B9Z47_10245 [Limnohabitans sp. 2KL-1]